MRWIRTGSFAGCLLGILSAPLVALLVIVPRFERALADSGAALPAPTVFIFRLSDYAQRWVLLALFANLLLWSALVAGYAMLRRRRATPSPSPPAIGPAP